MKRILSSQRFPKDAPRPAVTLGNFDGVHRGHQRLIARIQELAASAGGTSVVFTFDPHPALVLAPAECPPLIQTLEQRLAALEALRVDCCVIEPFTAELALLSAAAFFRRVIVERLHAAAVVVGYDFTFGLHRRGTTGQLAELGAASDIPVEVIEAEFLGERLISSTGIRRLIERGEVAEAAELLGRPYRMEGTVVAGRGIGRELSARTANLQSKNTLMPKEGVYLTRATAGEKRWPSITSVGNSPTFANAPFSIETHLLDAKVDLMGAEMAVDFLERMRDQIAFSSADELRGQIQSDIQAARRMHEARNARSRHEDLL